MNYNIKGFNFFGSDPDSTFLFALYAVKYKPDETIVVFNLHYNISIKLMTDSGFWAQAYAAGKKTIVSRRKKNFATFLIWL